MLTPVTVGRANDVYASLPQALGLELGMVVQEPNTGDFRQLLQADPLAAAPLKVGGALKLTGDYVVDMTAALGDIVYAVSDLAGVVIPAGSYFWATIQGNMNPLVADGVSADELLVASAVAGVLDTFDLTPAVFQNNNLLCRAANISGVPAQRAGIIL
jgi:hypothetical protein